MSTPDLSAATDGPSEAADDAVDEATPASPERGGVRWKRFGGMLALTGTMAVGLIALSAEGVLATQFSISGQTFVITATQLHGNGFAQFARIRELAKEDGQDDAEQKLTIVSAIDRATLTNLCQTVDMGGMYLKITAGDQPGQPVVGETMIVDSASPDENDNSDKARNDAISGDADFKKIDIGKDSSQLDTVPNPTGGYIAGSMGTFGQQAQEVTINNLYQSNYATTAAKFKLPHLRMRFTRVGCPGQ